MAKHRDQPHDALEQLESLGDRLLTWVSTNPLVVLGTAALILATAAAIGGYRAWQGSREDAASAELTAIRSEYVQAMGGEALDLEVPEPANPETARQARSDFVKRLEAFVAAHRGTASAHLAALEASRVHEELGQPVPALEVLEAAAKELSADDAMAGVVHSRIAVLHEKAGDFAAAAQAYEAAAEADRYPLRHEALAAAARAWAEAGRRDEALAAWQRLQAEAPGTQVMPHVRARLEEMARSAAQTPPAPADAAAADPS